MNDRAEKELKSDLLNCSFLLVREQFEHTKSPCRIVRGPIMHNGRIHNIEVNICIKENN